MTDKPMIFSAEMVRALLDGRKSMTRRILKPQPPADAHMVRAYTDNAPRPALRNTIGWFVPEAGDLWPCNDEDRIPLPYASGDRLWVREGWASESVDAEEGFYGPDYRATANGQPTDGRWRSPIHMPRWASRLTLVVTDVRLERVQETSNDDARAEGAPAWWRGLPEDQREPTTTAIGMFRDLWSALHGPDAWKRNDWVATITFTVHRCNIDQMEAAQ